MVGGHTPSLQPQGEQGPCTPDLNRAGGSARRRTINTSRMRNHESTCPPFAPEAALEHPQALSVGCGLGSAWRYSTHSASAS